MLLLYGAFVHSQLSASAGHDGGYDDGSDDEYGLEYGGQGAADGGEGDGGDEFAGGKHGSMLVLALLTGAIALLSDSLVSTIEGAASTLRLPTAFVSTILLPIVGNAAEHASAVLFAVRTPYLPISPHVSPYLHRPLRGAHPCSPPSAPPPRCS